MSETQECDPGGRRRVQVRSLWDNDYRVNVVIDDEVGAVRIANSFFPEADGQGNILASTPAITRQY